MTKSQKQYLLRALKIENMAGRDDAGRSNIYWSLDTPGHASVGRECERRGWIHSGPMMASWLKCLTRSGLAALATVNEKGHKS